MIVLMIVFIGVVTAFALSNHLNKRRERRNEDARERRQEQFVNLLETLKKKEEKDEE